MKKSCAIVLIMALVMTACGFSAYATESESWADELYAQYQQAVQDGQYEEAVAYLQQGIEGNDTRSIMQMGQAYYDGKIIEQDYEKALEYFQMATDMGDRKAPRSIAAMYEAGIGVEQSDDKAFEYYSVAAEAGDVTSQCMVGWYYEFGISVEQDYKKALEYYQLATAERQDGPVKVALAGLATLYEHGYAVEKDPEAAAQWYALAVEADYAHDDGAPKAITALTDVYGNGQRICGAVIEYNQVLDADTVGLDTYAVTNRTITGVYVNDEAAIPEASKDGRFVLITLDVNDADEYASVYKGGIVNGGNGPTGTSGTGILKYVYTEIEQLCGILTTDGTVLLPGGVYENHAASDAVIDKFEQRVFEDDELGASLMYNLFIPEDYDDQTSYPIVIFIADASANGEDVFLTLRQGNGATVWATEAEQAKHPCFVVAPQFLGSEGRSGIDTGALVMHLLTALEAEFSIDESRVYTTGQSQGCILSISMDEQYRDVFAGLLLVSGQNDAEAMRVMEPDNIWILLSEGDKKGYPGMNESVALWEADGVTVAKAVWDASWTADELNDAAADMRAEGTNIKYAAFLKGSTWDGDPQQEDPNEHNSAMHVAYNIEAVRDWLFEQRLGEVHP